MRSALVRRVLVAGAAAGALGAIALGGSAGAQDEERGARSFIRGLDGKVIGRLDLTPQRGGSVSVRIQARGLTPGYHGFHIHAVAACDPAARNPAGVVTPFASAGPHWNPDNVSHGDHRGDFPPLLVTRSGQTRAMFTTDRFRIPELLDMDGSAIIIHAARDNQANVPPRYQTGTPPATGPDAETRATGDSGGRVGCGAIRLAPRAR
ncbi:MAG: superoxide dismutase family protein [Thermoleophilaceae bacterium]|jgi:Cu-Zn family superoxide dismutase|nr:superoxide dismutase family protein [Thermoleophilaceae bacterium]